mgnify:CR=1 FL=1
MTSKEEKEFVIKEGELLKISPGIAKGSNVRNGGDVTKYLFVSKWCQLTENKFRYYKSKIQAYQNPHKPIFSINLTEISNI